MFKTWLVHPVNDLFRAYHQVLGNNPGHQELPAGARRAPTRQVNVSSAIKGSLTRVICGNKISHGSKEHKEACLSFIGDSCVLVNNAPFLAFFAVNH